MSIPSVRTACETETEDPHGTTETLGLQGAGRQKVVTADHLVTPGTGRSARTVL